MATQTFFSIVVGDCFDAVGERAKARRAQACTTESLLLSRQLGELGVFGFTLDMRQSQRLCDWHPINCVGLPVLRCGFFAATMEGRSIDGRRGSEINPRPNSCPSACCIFLAAVTQVKIQLTAVFLVFPDMLIDALVTDKGRHHPSPDGR